MPTQLRLTDADLAIKACIDEARSFSVVAGAGSGKTTSLVTALDYIRSQHGKLLRRDGNKIACITFTNRAVNVISERLGWDELYHVSTLHSFMWQEIKRFSLEIRTCLVESIIPAQIVNQRERDKGGQTQTDLKARKKATALEEELEIVREIEEFKYDDTAMFSNYAEGLLSHDDVIAISAEMIGGNETLKKIIGQKYPYIFVDEAQDTFENIVTAINAVCQSDGLPIVGYFGDSMQQIYEKRAGDFHGPEGSEVIQKTENFRCSPQVINLLNAFRPDLQQYPAGNNADLEGSVALTLVQAAAPLGPRKTYTENQLERTASIFDELLNSWHWNGRTDVKLLFLVHQMIARRLGFIGLHKLFTGTYSSSRAQEDYQSGEHALLKPLIRALWPLVENYRSGDKKAVLDILRNFSPAFHPEGENQSCTVADILALAEHLVSQLSALWDAHSMREILDFARATKLYKFSDRMIEELDRQPMQEDFDADLHAQDKGRWLADEFFGMGTSELVPYVSFLNNNTPFSTQHGVKGEEYKDVCAVFDDTEAAWNIYSFAKMFTPATSGQGTDGQMDRSRKLAYVCFSRAEVNLKVVLFTLDPGQARSELLEAGLFSEDQITIFG